ncbi:plasmid recombination protein [Hymenobacter sp. DH14]|uniref:Plasmid recombination protein n=1 Tax=Hymenobacter cyanobacteriorum TaxID=2926463 RepID=A0A9X1VGP5_9BACT|nr:MobV family relaxase [Hymenobacter cyanobacteriorum]MCI1187862.1 plasmid recombination protein [Hymenobacter cyanobacteriorum]
MPYAILLVSKLTTPGMATSATQHNYRLEETPNADPAQTWRNMDYVNFERRPYLDLANERLAEINLVPRRRDAVRLVELVLTASADGFPRGADGRVPDLFDSPWLKDNFKFVEKQFGAKNVVGFMLHQDEITPHLHVLVVPITSDGRLSCRDVFSPARLHQLQTDYAEAMAPHGLARGIKYSTAKHEDVRRYHGAQQMSKEQLTELARPLVIAPYQLPVPPERMTMEQYRQESQAAFNSQLARLQAQTNQKIGQLATVATANAYERERARVLEKRLASSQNLVVETHAELTTQKGTLTAQVQQLQQELSTRTAELAEQKALTTKAHLNHLRAVMKHLQGEPLSEKLTAWGQGQRQTHQAGIERGLAKQLLKPIEQVADMVPVLLKNSYVLEVISPEKFTLTHEKNGMRFSSDELRPNGRDFLEQLREAVGKRKAQERAGQAPNRDGGIEL